MKDQELIPNTASPVAGLVPTLASVGDRAVAERPGFGAVADSRNGSRPVDCYEELMVVDDRSGLTPSQMVETKLMTLLRGSSLPVSQLQSRSFIRGRAQS